MLRICSSRGATAPYPGLDLLNAKTQFVFAPKTICVFVDQRCVCSPRMTKARMSRALVGTVPLPGR